MDDTQNQFVADAKDIVERLYTDLEQLRAVRLQGRQRRELAARIFRYVHTLKGSAGSFGLKSVSDIAHEFEGVLDGVRLGRVSIDDSLLDLFEDAAHAIAQALESKSLRSDSNGQTIIQRLKLIASASQQQGNIAGSLRTALPDDIARSLSEYDLQHAREAVREGANLFIVGAGFSIDTFDRNFRELSRLLGKSGEVIATVPATTQSADEINFRLLYAAPIIPDQVKRKAGELGTIEFSDIPLQPADVPSQSAAESVGKPTQIILPAPSVRIGLNELDSLTSSVSDLLRETTKAISLRTASSNDEIVATRSHLRRRFVQLEERLIKLRLVPLSGLLHGAAARAGRVAARQMAKDIEFEIIGGDVGIDKSLADIIAEPLLHLVRNAVGHGIETPKERLAAGKPATGIVRLEAFNIGSRIDISVSDDGRGIDLSSIAKTATENGIVNKPEDLSADQCLRLIFRPGFSTSGEVTDLSGRGIGLDIVDRAMEQAGGEVRVSSGPGRGTTFTMMIPATLALVQCVVVRSGDQLYCIDSDVVTDRGSLARHELAEIAQADLITWNSEELPLLSLSKLLAQTQPSESNGSFALLVCDHRKTSGMHQNRVALLVDAIAGQQETLIRSLGPYSARWHGISGAAELLDGNIALMLDLERLIEANEN